MDRKQSGLIFFSIIAFFLYAFGVELFENVWSFPEIRKIPLMVIALVGTGIYATVRLGFPQIKYLKHEALGVVNCISIPIFIYTLFLIY